MAAHIYSASENGPRGTGGLTVAERSAPENGIWCCYSHGTVIDSEHGGNYSPTQLRAYKRLHEARKAAEVNGGVLHHIGLVESISVNAAPVSSLEGRTFDLGMRNVITGANGTGKSILTRLIASVAYPDHIAELSRCRDVDMAVRWFDPLTHDVLTKGRAGNVTHVLDGQSVPYVARPYKTILLEEARPETIVDIVNLAQLFDLSVSAMKATLTTLATQSDLVREVRYENNQVHWTLDVDGRKLETAGYGLSGWLQSEILVELAGVHARHHARVEPTILILDGFLSCLCMSAQVALLERVEQIAEDAQVAIVTPFPIADALTADWTVTALDRSPLDSRDTPFDFEVATRPTIGNGGLC